MVHLSPSCKTLARCHVRLGMSELAGEIAAFYDEQVETLYISGGMWWMTLKESCSDTETKKAVTHTHGAKVLARRLETLKGVALPAR